MLRGSGLLVPGMEDGWHLLSPALHCEWWIGGRVGIGSRLVLRHFLGVPSPEAPPETLNRGNPPLPESTESPKLMGV